MDNLKALARQGTTVIVTSHVLSLVERCCDEVAIVAKGELAWRQRLDDTHGAPLEHVYLELTGRIQIVLSRLGYRQPMLEDFRRMKSAGVRLQGPLLAAGRNEES